MDDEDAFASVQWESKPDAHADPEPSQDDAPPATAASSASPARASTSRTGSTAGGAGSIDLKPEGYMTLDVREPNKELEGTKDVFVSYAIVGSTSLPMYSTKSFATRRRFQDFVFLRDHLSKDFPACVVPPLPDKHRLEYITGDRFSPDFVEKRRTDLQRFLTRIARHPTLSRSTLLQAFLESTEWNVRMHQHLAHPPAPEPPPSLLENISDSLLNAFAKVRKPDERFVEVREALDRFEEALNGIDRIYNRTRARLADLSSDYDDFAGSIEGLSFLESGITDPLRSYESALLDFSHALKKTQAETTDPFLYHLHSLQAYSVAFRSVLKLRDQKQLDFEELSAYCASLTNERDRLAAGAPLGAGLTSYLKARVDSLRGNELSRDERMNKLDGKIKELQEAVTTAHETSDAFNDEVLREYDVFQLAKRIEMKELLTGFADGQIELSKATLTAYDKTVPALERIHAN